MAKQKMKASKCACGSAGAMVFACSGGSNVGQIANDAAVRLNDQGTAKLYCLVGAVSHIPGMVKGAESAEYIIAIDGCPVGCAKKALEHLKLKIDEYIVVTEKGIKKTYDLHPRKADIDKILKKHYWRKEWKKSLCLRLKKRNGRKCRES